MSGPRICSRCKEMPLLDETEIDAGICGDCADALMEQDHARREWAFYHGAETILNDSGPVGDEGGPIAGEPRS